MTAAFVTGGTGFIGQRLLRALAAHSIPAVALVRRPDHGLREGPLLTLRQTNLLDGDSLAHSMAGCGVGYHLAARVSFDPAEAAELRRVNVEGTRCFLRAARQAGLRRVVVVSSASTVGISRSASSVLNEAAPFDRGLIRHNVYLASKKETEELALAESGNGLEVMVANPTTVFGPGDHALNSGSIIRTVVAGRVVPVPPGGTSVVDVDDVAEGLVALMANGSAGRRYILTAENLPFREVFATIAGVTGRRPTFVPLGVWFRSPMKLAGGALHLALKAMGRPAWLITPQIIEDTFFFKYYSARQAREELGWKPQFSFSESVQRAWSYYLDEGLLW